MSNLAESAAIIWDWDGTIVSSHQTIDHIATQTFDHFSISHDLRTWAQPFIGGAAAADYFPQIFGEDNWHHAYQYFQQQFQQVHLDGLLLLPQAQETLAIIKQDHPNLAMVVVSNLEHNLLQQQVTHFALAKYFNAIVGRGATTEAKPHQAPAVLALSQVGLTLKHQLLVIGDSVTDLQLAHNCGCQAILISESKPEKLPANVLLATVTNHQQLQQLLQLSCN